MGIFSRKFEIEHKNEAIKFEATVEKIRAHTSSKLIINGQVQDQVETTPRDGIFGCKISLNGVLVCGNKVRLEILAHFFRRPLYSLFVDNQLIYRNKGTWGGV